jgi:protein phosphatase PTC7|tara:strand:- start:5328 stop:6089 length:762 start_codon:yes stop_codon:yes gene_type:complete
MRIYWGASNIPRYDKKRDGGDDGWFISEESQSAGVADGVGAWRDKNIKPGIYTRSLMAITKNRVQAGLNPYDGIKSAYEEWKDKSNYGSTTFCVTQMRNNTLFVAQLGDSCILVQRKGRVVYQSNEQEHLFNIPFQLGSGNDSIEDAWRYQISLLPGDTIVLASDGLFNNLYRSGILSIINSYPISTEDTSSLAQTIAEELAAVAEEQSNNPKIWSPYAQRSYEMGITEAFALNQLGGKPDDITVIVGRVLKD